jgi:hypothetical protein
MIRVPHISKWLFGILLAAASCGSKDTFEIKVENQNLCVEAAEMLCRNIFQCCTGANIEGLLGVKISTDEGECRRDLQLICEKKNHTLLNAVEKGKAKILSDKATLCLNALMVKEDNCFVDEPQPAWYAACKDVFFEGLVMAEEPCQTSLECQPNHFCAVDMKCKPLPQEGEPCPETRCAKGLFCSFQEKSKKLICMPLGVEDETCTQHSECNEGLYCDYPITSSGLTESDKSLCRVKKDLGERCESNNSCTSGNCIPGFCSNKITMACYTDHECGGTCEKSQKSCLSDSSCNGTCSKSGYSCSSDSSCDSYSGDKCLLEKCVLHRCEGTPLCGEVFRLTDYCAGPLAQLLGTEEDITSPVDSVTIPTNLCSKACQKTQSCGVSYYDAICEGTCSGSSECAASCVLSSSCSELSTPSSNSTLINCLNACQK